jgi:hypothetical protein
MEHTSAKTRTKRFHHTARPTCDPRYSTVQMGCMCATPILSDIQQTTADIQHTLSTILKHDHTPTSPNGQNSQQLKRKAPTTPTPTTLVAQAKRQMTSRSSSTSSNPQSPNTTLPTRSDGRHLRSRTSSLSTDPTTSNDPVQVCTWSKYTWQKLTKAPKGSQMFHSPPLIRVFKKVEVRNDNTYIPRRME